MALIDRHYLARPYYGSRRMAAGLATQGHLVNRKRVQRLMRLMGLEAIYQRPNTSKGAWPSHPIKRNLPNLLLTAPVDPSRCLLGSDRCLALAHTFQRGGRIRLARQAPTDYRRGARKRHSLGQKLAVLIARRHSA